MKKSKYIIICKNKIEVIMKIDRSREIREDKDLFQKDIANFLKITQVQYYCKSKNTIKKFTLSCELFLFK